MRVEINTLTAELFLKLYTSVGWEPPCKEQVEEALKNTSATFTVFEDTLSCRLLYCAKHLQGKIPEIQFLK